MKKLLRVLIVLVFGLITHHSSLITVFAATPPNPQPCKNPVVTDNDQLVNNYLVDKSGKPPIAPLAYNNIKGDAEGKAILEPRTFTFQVDFSKLQALFGGTNSNFLEGEVQNPEHLQKDVTGSNSQDFNEYFRAVQKTTVKVLLDQRKIEYVKYIIDKPGLPESSNKYNDIDGAGELKTIYDLVNNYGLPDPPQPNEDSTTWDSTWGKYWSKMPTAWSQFYTGEIFFHIVVGDKALQDLKKSDSCPANIKDANVNFVLPDFYRTTAVSDQLNRNIVARAVQSYQEHDILNSNSGASVQKTSPLSDFFSYCWKLLTSPSSVAREIKKAVSGFQPPQLQPLTFLNPSPALAANDNPSCIKLPGKAKTGQAPYCPLPLTEITRLGSHVSCRNQDDTLKLEKDNSNVICTFTFQTQPKTFDIDSEQCTNSDLSEGCNVNVYIIPNFRIPWIAAIWNNTLLSDSDPGLNSLQKVSGKPGIYGFFTPKMEDPQLKELTRIRKICADSTNPDYGALDCSGLATIWASQGCQAETTDSEFLRCLGFDKKLSGQTQNSSDSDPKELLIGGVHCGQYFVSQNALKQIAIQNMQGVQQECPDSSLASNLNQPPVNIPNCSDPNIANPSDNVQNNGIETSRDQLVCYIVQVAAGKKERLSGDSLADVMIRVMGMESGGQQCAVSTFAALGVFQFVAGTWNEQPESRKPMDSGNGQGMAIGEINPGHTCWGVPGPEPTATSSNSNEYNWPLQSDGQNLDSGVWNPFWQIDATARIMQSVGGCIWTPYQQIYQDKCNGFLPAN